MGRKYNKLVRDRIPEIINSKGEKAICRILDDEEYLKELNIKLLEEANEFIEAGNIEELADIMEVLEAIAKVKNIDWEDVRKEQKFKRDKRGAFEEKIYLEGVK